MIRRYHQTLIVFLCCQILALGLSLFPTRASYAESLDERLRTRIETARTHKKFTCRGELICGIADLPLFYLRRGNKPAWIGNNLDFPLADELIQSIRESTREGLTPNIYHLKQLKFLLNAIRQKEAHRRPLDPKTLIDFEILLTDAFLFLGSHLRGGRVNPETIHTKWIVENPEVDMAAVLQLAIKSKNIRAALQKFIPPQNGYAAMRKALLSYRKIHAKGGWPLIPPGISLRLGDREPRVMLLRQRLIRTGDFEAVANSAQYDFDEPLEKAVRRFQRRHGLKADGVVGRKTLAALNVPVKDRIRQIEINMERWRWIPPDLGRHFLLVNIADFKLTVFENSQPVMDMRVVVGRNARRTPVFSARLKYLVINPYWNIPSKIAVRDILPKVKTDVGYLRDRKIRVLQDWSQNAPQLDPYSINWFETGRRHFPYKLRQDPGPLNALGRIKFMFPNKFEVYLHDTPAKELFQKTSRDFSSGCIRLERPIDLAAYLLSAHDRWSADNISKTIKSGQRKIVKIEETVYVHLLYWTAWVDKEGRLHFRKDIYDRDMPLDRALNEIHGQRMVTNNDRLRGYQVLTGPVSTWTKLLRG